MLCIYSSVAVLLTMTTSFLDGKQVLVCKTSIIQFTVNIASFSMHDDPLYVFWKLTPGDCLSTFSGTQRAERTTIRPTMESCRYLLSGLSFILSPNSQKRSNRSGILQVTKNISSRRELVTQQFVVP